jgi:phosphoglycerate dehydrogenase-like enzyme
MRVALLDDYFGNALNMADWGRLAGRLEVESIRQHIQDEDTLVSILQPFDAVILMRERTLFPRPVIERLKRLKLIVTAAMWNVAIDIDAATENGIQVCGTGDTGNLTAELTLGLMIALARHLPSEERALREGKWQVEIGEGLKGKTLGILGLGKLGSQVAGFGRMLGMDIIAWSQNLTDQAAIACGARRVAKEELFALADFISIHVKLSERTRGIVDAEMLSRMKHTAYIINTSRGPIIDEKALYRTLSSRQIAGAALDVYSTEPLPLDDPIRSLDNVILLPHLGYVARENWQRIYGDALEDIEAFLEGKILRALNQPASPRWPDD